MLFLWITFFVELTGYYAGIAHFTQYKYFSFVKDTLFQNNYWLYNGYTLLSFSFFIYYFRSFLRSASWRLLLAGFLGFFIFSSILSFFITDTFFTSYSQFVSLVGTLLLSISIVLFYFELLRSDMLLQLKHFLPLYISAGVLVFNLCVTPIDIFSEYFKNNTFLVELKVYVYLYANIFMYSSFIIGFIICSKKKRSY